MSRENHKWRKDEPPPYIRAHSLAKHRVIKAYLERYVSVLTADPRRKELRLTLVDGFAGGGMYRDEETNENRPGSPLIMLEAMRKAAEAAKEARKTKQFNLDVDYFFIEKNLAAYEYLREVISESEFRSLLANRIRLIPGEFVAQVPKLIDHIKSRGRSERAIFVLDQFGYLDVPFATIGVILESLEHAEVILTFATDWLIHYLNSSDETQERLNRLGLVLPPNAIDDAKAQREWRRIIQFSLHAQMQERTGAQFYTPFFIRSTEAQRDYWLIHLSGHQRARDVMVGLHWKETNSFAHYGKSGLRMLGFDQTKREEWKQQKLLSGYFFDETARISSEDELLNQLPERLSSSGFKKGASFYEIFGALTNETPVTSDIMIDVINSLAKQGDFKITDKDGHKRRSGIQHHSDIVIPNQKRLFLPAPTNE
ncbi:MAG: three-Cys-motif partner protein TcmP [Pirellulaceae bacterium]|nr:three-Cys-motif partner protein TcmP [Pirellulaceae bacterium]